MPKDHEVVVMRIGAPVQLLLSYLIAAGAGAGVVWLLDSRRPSTLAVALVTGAALGFLATANLQRELYVIALALHRLARGGQVEPESLPRAWPLGDLCDDVAAVAGRVSEQARREQETADYREQLLRRVSAAAAQEERNRLARELHDSIKQQIFSMSLSAAAAQARWDTDPEGARSAIADVQRSAQEAQVEMQALLQQLRPAALENVGLQEALRIQSEALQYRTGARVRVEEIDMPAEDLLAPGAQETIFRVAQELLSNVARHARAQNVWLRLVQRDGAVHLSVRDDGQGFDPRIQGTGTGLASVRERAQTLGGGLEVESVPGQGTVVRMRIPLRYPSSAFPHDDTAERETDRLRDERRKALTVGSRAVQISAVLIFLAAPFAAVALATGAAIYGYVRARLYYAQLAVRSGRTEKDAAVQYREAGLLMPGGMDGIEAIRRIRQLAPGLHVVALTSYTDDARVVASLRAGAVGYVRKDASPEVLVASIRAAARGHSLLDPTVAAAVFHQLDRAVPRGADLTDRERDVLRQVALGRSNREIADALVVSGETVKTHVASILSKLGLASRTQVIIYALKQGLVALDEIEL